MIKVLFDYEIFSAQLYGGISRYFANIAEEMNKGKIAKVKIAVLYVKNYYVRNFWQPYNNFIGRRLLKKDWKRYIKNKKYSEKLLQKGAHDIYHATYYDTYALEFNRKPMVITVHDMIHEDSPEMFTNSDIIIEQKRKMMDAASAIIAISNYTKDRILFHHPEYESKITVVYHGLSSSTKNISQPKISLPDKFLLFVGERGHYKSFSPFIAAITPLLIADKDLKVIAAGGKAFNEVELDFLSKLGVEEQCMQLNATDDLLSHLYQKAMVFVYPSTQEGFGLPLLEAFKNNCAIACSNSSCLPEIGGNAVAYFNTRNPDALLSTVEKIIFDLNYANELRAAGKERLKMFTMDNCVKNTIEVYQKIFTQ